ncbi:hypothetical protein BJY04DRAFT_230352 [Aspergillus karnatakaensis]|uniref:uncharacterized protein n=1 Tax=Aspergillus karnatakaensis TaxID=1810916 RepID=UPI003CCD327D
MFTSLLQLPNELLLLIFHQLPTIGDASNLAQSCSSLHQLFSNGGNKIDILRSAARVPWNPDYQLGKAFSGLSRIPPLSWRLPSSRPGMTILLEVDYEVTLENTAKPVLWDLSSMWHSPRYDSSTFTEVLQDFVSQFRQLNARLGNYFESETQEIYDAAVTLQENILCSLSTPVTDLSTEATVIALACHCYVCFSAFDIIAGYSATMSEDELFDEGSPVVLLDNGDSDNRIIPTIRASREELQRKPPSTRGLETDVPAPTSHLHPDSDMYVLLTHLGHLCFQLLDSKDSRHWPTVLYVLGIMSDINYIFPHLRGWLRTTHVATKALDGLYNDLARYYYICTDGGVILSHRWSEEVYASRVGHDQSAVGHARLLHRIWVDAGRPETQGVDGFGAKVEYFMAGCAI